MGKPVSGFLANDGSFHETEAEADFRDAEDEIRNWCVSHTVDGVPYPVDDNALLEYVEALADPIYRYLNAKDRIDVETARKETNATVGGINHEESENWHHKSIADYIAEVSKTDAHSADDERTEDVFASVFEQPTDRHEPVPDVGSSPPAESVLDQRPSDGSRSRKRHARGIRGGSTLAVDDENGS
jgi:hypothetical protein